MNPGSAARLSFRMSLICLLAVPLMAFQITRKNNVRSIYVVALRNLTESGVFRECRKTGVNPPLPAFPAPELIPSTADAIQGGISDPVLKTEVEQVFRKKNQYRLANSVKDADLVFVIEGKYTSNVVATRPNPGRQGAMYVIAGPMDYRSFFLELALAIVVPADAYRQNPADMEALLKARLWESTVGSFNDASAGLEQLVNLFHKGEQAHLSVTFDNSGANADGTRRARDEISKNRGDLTICAATQPARAAAPKAGVQADVSPREAGGGKAAAGGPPGESPAGMRIRTEVMLVSVPVVVTDDSGKRICDLQKPDFRIFENGAEQAIDRLISEAEPFNVALILDTSGSMGTKLEEIKRAAATFAETLRPEDRIMLVSFNGRVFVDSEFTGDRNRVLGALIQMRRGVYTRLYDALALVMTERLDLVSGRKAIVLLTDGVDTASRLADAPGTLATMGESGVPVYVIQYDTKSWMARPEPPALAISKAPAGFFNNDPDYARADRYLQELSDAGGGRIERTATTDGIRDAFLRIAEELRCQYTLCYYPADQTRDGSVRSLRVEVGRTGVKLRTRAAYRMGAKPPGGK